jgi:D-3-phosphoglycerate dehydrogenase / 2-oxoglutarate reductase
MAATRNKKRVFYSNTLSEVGRALLNKREDIEAVSFPAPLTGPDFVKLISAGGETHGAILGGTRFGEPECEAAKGLQVIARIGVGFDAIDVPALTKRRVPLMTVGIANSPSVAEQAMHMMLSLAKRGAELNALVASNTWANRMSAVPFDLLDKTVLIIGFGRIGTRTAKRCAAMEMKVVVYDPYVPAAAIKAAGYEAVSDLDAALPRADFVSVHCPKTPETIGLFNAARLAKLKPTAYLINTARGGIVDEPALYTALTSGKLAAAGLDVYDKEPPEPDNPLLKLPNVLSAPHMAGVTKESLDRMAIQAVENCLSVFDGRPIRDNVINPEVLG